MQNFKLDFKFIFHKQKLLYYWKDRKKDIFDVLISIVARIFKSVLKG